MAEDMHDFNLRVEELRSMYKELHRLLDADNHVPVGRSYYYILEHQCIVIRDIMIRLLDELHHSPYYSPVRDHSIPPKTKNANERLDELCFKEYDKMLSDFLESKGIRSPSNNYEAWLEKQMADIKNRRRISDE